MLNLQAVTHEDFEPRLHERFTLETPTAASAELELVSVETRGRFDPARDKRQVFSIVFRGASDSNLPQSIYRLTNETLGVMELFLVPLGPDETGTLYEAVFT